MRALRHAAAVAAVAVVVSGCSVYEDFTTSDFAKQDDETIVDTAGTTMRDVTSMRMTGELRDRGERYFVDVRVDRDDTCTGMVSHGRSHLDIRRIGHRAWFKGEASALGPMVGASVPAEVLRRMSTQWFPVPARQAAGICDFGALLKTFEVVDVGSAHETGRKNKLGKKGDELGGRIDVTVDGESDLGGETVVKLTGRPAGTHDESIWVLSDAPHYVVRMASTEASGGGDLSFSEFDEDVVVEAPKPKDVVKP